VGKRRKRHRTSLLAHQQGGLNLGIGRNVADVFIGDVGRVRNILILVEAVFKNSRPEHC
jgi:hypothetical protein